MLRLRGEDVLPIRHDVPSKSRSNLRLRLCDDTSGTIHDGMKMNWWLWYRQNKTKHNNLPLMLLWGEMNDSSDWSDKVFEQAQAKTGMREYWRRNGCCRVRLLPVLSPATTTWIPIDSTKRAEWTAMEKRRCCYDDGVLIEPETISNRMKKPLSLWGEMDCSGIREIQYWLLKQ